MRCKWLAALVCLAALGPGCKDKPEKKGKTPVKTGEQKQPPAPGTLPADKAFTSGTVKAAVLDVQTRLAVANLGPAGDVSDEVKKAQEGSVLTAQLVVSDERGKMVFTTEDFYVPEGTELRYNPANPKYVLADMNKKVYWALTGAELGNLLEGGPSMKRTDYTIEVKDVDETIEVAGMKARRSDVEISFQWSVKTKAGERTGKATVSMPIWHTSDERLEEPWGDMMVDLLTVPFQDDGGRKIIETLKKKVAFPVKWNMKVNAGTLKEGEEAPSLMTTVTSLEVKDVPRPELATPPAGHKPATGPYEFGEGGQTASPDLLSKIPAKQGKPPKGVEPPEDQK